MSYIRIPGNRLADGQGDLRDYPSHHEDGSSHNLAPPSPAFRRPPGSLSANQSDQYSDDDIALVYEIVNLAELLLPNLPERDQLPTTALFLAAEDVLRERHLDPDNIPPHISRLIFKIGGERSRDSLGDKFHAVLEGLGIDLQFTDAGQLSDTSSLAQSPQFPNTGILVEPTRATHTGSVSGSSRNVSLEDLPQPASVHRKWLAHSPTAPRPAPSASVPSSKLRQGEASIEELEARLQALKQRQDNELLAGAFSTWHAKTRQRQQDNDAFWPLAVRTDARTLLTEVLDIWREEAQDAQERKADAEAAIEHSQWVAKMEKRASRVYEIYTARTTLDAWRSLALEERDRTAVARRHLVRKRAFDGWHAQHIEDEMKVENFILGHALKKWKDTALHQEVRSEVASQWYDQRLMKDSVDTMWEEYNNRIADEVYATELVNDCLRHWSTKAREFREEYQIASALDERLVRDEIVKNWLDALDTQRFDAHERTRQWLILGCRRDLDYWQEQARLSALLRQYITKRDQEVIRDALDVWQRAVAHAQDEAAVADAFMVMEPIEHWEREMKLKLWVEREEHETKAAVLEHWALEEKLAWYRRYDDTNLKRQTLDTFFAAAQQARRERESLERDAAEVDAYYLAGDTVDAWLGAVDKMRIHHHNANLVNLYRTTRPCIDHWREQQQLSQARTAYFRRQADKHRARALVNDVLDRWPGIAEAARRERMMTKLRQFRRKYKVELAQECLDQWLEATADALDRKDDADQVHLEYKREDLKDCLDLWNRAAKQAQVFHQIAADAELEVYLNKWQEQFEEAKENLQDAIDYDADNTRRRCWEKWEFETLQAGGKRHLATTLLEKNERRVRRRILNEWHQKAVPGAADLLNPRLSTLSARRSVRQQLSRSTTAASGFYTASQLAILRPPPDPGSSTPQVGLGPMSEFDEEPLVPDPDDPGFMSTPTRLRSSTRTPARRLTSTPSAILPSPYERELRRQYGGVGLMRQRGVGFSDINEESGEDLEH
ncbi:hypothetical protein VTJ04DRAFT_8475 [Mycothermus thermophilus]|uniref:uncharacterized protein n=1 Tax=Humicola insolens TaxID=85995 RepID=UPI003744B15F